MPLSPSLSPLAIEGGDSKGRRKAVCTLSPPPLGCGGRTSFVAQLPTTPFTAGKHATKDLPRSQVGGCWEGVARNNNYSNILTGQTAVVNKYLLLSGLTPGLAAPLCSSRGGGGCRRRRRLLPTFPESPRPLPPSQCSSLLAPGCTSSSPPFPTICRSPNDLTPSTTSPCPRRLRRRRRSLLLPRAILHPVLPGAVRSARDRLPGVQAAGKKKNGRKWEGVLLGVPFPSSPSFATTILCRSTCFLSYCHYFTVVSISTESYPSWEVPFAKDIFVCVL